MKNKNIIDDKLVKKILIFLSLIILFFCLIIFIDNNRIKYISHNYDLDNISKWKIEEIKEEFIYIKIKGWSYIPGKYNQAFNTKILLKDTKTNSYIEINTDMRAKWSYIDEENNGQYFNVGFIATINKYLLKKDTDYEICILSLHDKTEKIIYTKEFIRR